MQPVVLREAILFSSPWCDLVAKRVRYSGGEAERIFLGVRAADCVSVVAVTSDGRIPLVRQYRPVVEQVTLELPSGHVDPGESPANAARRELREETGCVAAEVELMGRLIADSGRLEYRQWCYFAPKAVRAASGSWRAEPDVEVVFHTPRELREILRRGTLDHAPHVAALSLAVLQGWLDL